MKGNYDFKSRLAKTERKLVSVQFIMSGPAPSHRRVKGACFELEGDPDFFLQGDETWCYVLPLWRR